MNHDTRSVEWHLVSIRPGGESMDENIDDRKELKRAEKSGRATARPPGPPPGRMPGTIGTREKMDEEPVIEQEEVPAPLPQPAIAEYPAQLKTGVTINDAYRYIDWLLMMPLLPMKIVMVQNMPAYESSSKCQSLGIGPDLMTSSGYKGELVVQGNLSAQWPSLYLSMCFFLWIACTLCAGDAPPGRPPGKVSSRRTNHQKYKTEVVNADNVKRTHENTDKEKEVGKEDNDVSVALIDNAKGSKDEGNGVLKILSKFGSHAATIEAELASQEAVSVKTFQDAMTAQSKNEADKERSSEKIENMEEMEKVATNNQEVKNQILNILTHYDDG